MTVTNRHATAQNAHSMILCIGEEGYLEDRLRILLRARRLEQPVEQAPSERRALSKACRNRHASCGLQPRGMSLSVFTVRRTSEKTLKREHCGRAALVARAIGGDAIARLCRPNYGRRTRRVAGRCCRLRSQRMGYKERSMPKRRIRAPFGNYMETRRNVLQLHRHRAVVFPPAPATGGKLRIAGGRGERGRNQRKAEHRHQQHRECASHAFHPNRSLDFGSARGNAISGHRIPASTWPCSPAGRSPIHRSVL